MHYEICFIMYPHMVSFPIKALFRSDHGWLGCCVLLCHGRTWRLSCPRRWRLVPALQLSWPVIHPQWRLSGVGSVVGRRHICNSGVSGELWGSVHGRGFGENNTVKGVRAEIGWGLWLCVRSCRQLFRHRSVFSLPTKILFQSLRGIRAAWCKNKVMDNKQILLSFSGFLELKLAPKVRANKALPMKARNLPIKDYLQCLNFTLCNFYLNGMGLWQPNFWWCPFCSILMPYCK